VLVQGVREAVGVGSCFDDGAVESEPLDDRCAEPWVGEALTAAGSSCQGPPPVREAWTLSTPALAAASLSSAQASASSSRVSGDSGSRGSGAAGDEGFTAVELRLKDFLDPWQPA
jgi:hypothetical protein